MQELGNAINDSLSESDRIARAIGEIEMAGYDVFLVLEATIGFNRRDDNAEDEEDNQPEVTEEPNRTFEATGNINFSTHDHRFLRCEFNLAGGFEGTFGLFGYFGLIVF